MTSRDFAYWLQGYFEIAKPVTIHKEEVEMIQKHLSMVFVHEIDPLFGEDNAKLNVIHNSSIKTEGNLHIGNTIEPLYRC